MTDKTTPEAIGDEDLDAVQGAGSAVAQVGKPGAKSVVLSSESETNYVRAIPSSEGVGSSKGIVLSSETENPYFRKR